MNIFLSNDALIQPTRIAMTRALADGRIAISAKENIVRPAGGGQPRDHAVISIGGRTIAIEDVVKNEGETWLVLDILQHCQLEVDAEIILEVDAARRHALSRAHSLTHLAMGAIRERVDGYESKGADIGEDASLVELRFRASRAIEALDAQAIDRAVRSLIHADLSIEAERVKSVAFAEEHYPKWRVDPDLNLNGRIRVIHIAGFDSNPCSGSHVRRTSEIGPYALINHRVNGAGINLVTLRIQDSWSYWY